VGRAGLPITSTPAHSVVRGFVRTARMNSAHSGGLRMKTRIVRNEPRATERAFRAGMTEAVYKCERPTQPLVSGHMAQGAPITRARTTSHPRTVAT